jgi:hypothetical protein
LVIYLLFFRRKEIEYFNDSVDGSEWQIKEEKLNFKEIILDFEKEYLSLESKDFLKEISFVFKGFLEEDLGYENFSKMTLEEICEVESWKLKAESWTEKILKILEIIYFKEYKEENLTQKQKEKIFLEIKNIIFDENI